MIADDPGGTHFIIPALWHLAVPIASVRPSPLNPNEGDTGALCQQLEERGQHVPIVVQRSTGLIIAGNHRWAAATALGWSQIAVAHVDDDDTQALARMLGDNLPGRRSRDDEATLAQVLAKLNDAGALESSGYTGDDLDDVLLRLEDTSPIAVPTPPASTPAPRAPEGQMSLTLHVPEAVYESWQAVVLARGGTPEAVFADLVSEAVA